MAILIRTAFGNSTRRKRLVGCWTYQPFGNPEGIVLSSPGWALGWNPLEILCALLVLAVGWILATPVSIAAETLHPEYQVKAAYLVNLPKYVDWPAEAFAEANSPIVIAVLGESEVIGEIQKVITGRTVNGRKIVLKRLASGEVSGVCHILFVPAAEQRRSPNLLAKLQNTRVLTVGEKDDFLERGGIINLALRNQEIALEVNLEAAGNTRINISSKLLGLAKVVKGKTK